MIALSDSVSEISKLFVSDARIDQNSNGIELAVSRLSLGMKWM